MFEILLKKLIGGFAQIKMCKTIEEKKNKALEIGFTKNLMRMKDVDEPTFEKYFQAYKKEINP